MRFYALLIMRAVLNVFPYFKNIVYSKEINSAYTMKSYEELEV
jgi:hypothetical protein